VPDWIEAGAFITVSGALAGSIRFPDGSPVPHLTVLLIEHPPTAGPVRILRADAAGQFQTEDLPLSRYSFVTPAVEGVIPLMPDRPPASGANPSEISLELGSWMLLVELPAGCGEDALLPVELWHLSGTSAVGPPAPEDLVFITQAARRMEEFPLVFLLTSPGWVMLRRGISQAESPGDLIEIPPDRWLTRAALPL
jgi:hypothetical protein